MQKRDNWQGKYYLDNDGICVAKTCYSCRNVLSASLFGRNRDSKFNLAGLCRKCDASRNHERQTRLASDGVSTVQAETIRIRRQKYNLRSDNEIIQDRFRLRSDGTKTCKSCKTHGLFSDFYSDKGLPDGLADICKYCANDYAKAHRTKEYIDHWGNKNIPVICYVCKTIESIQIDHVIPKKLHGSDDPSNRLPLCAKHNVSKNGRTLNKWLLEYHPDKYDEVMHRVIVEYQVWPFVKGHDLVITVDR